MSHNSSSSPAGDATRAYNQLLEDVQTAINRAVPALVFVDYDPRQNSTGLCFTSQLADVPTTKLCRRLTQMFEEQVDLEVRTRDTHTEFIFLVPHSSKIKWRCCERFSKTQLGLMAISVLQIFFIVAGAIAVVRWLL